MASTPETTTPQIKPPYGFQEVVALTKTHRVLLPKGTALPMTFRNMNPIPVSYTEFPIAARDYPLVFISGDQGKTFTPMLVTGLASQQNLFVMWDNTWDRRAYVPAYVRRYPFCMTRVMVDGKEAPERVASVEKIAINDKGEKLFDDKGEATTEWENRQKLLFEYEADLARTEAREPGGYTPALAAFNDFNDWSPRFEMGDHPGSSISRCSGSKVSTQAAMPAIWRSLHTALYPRSFAPLQAARE